MKTTINGEKGDICPPNLESEIELELEIEDRQIDINNIYTQIEKISLVQNQTNKYNKIFIDKGIYISPNVILPNELLNQIKLYQSAIKELVDLNQNEIISKVDLIILEKVFGQVVKYENDNIVPYFKTALINEFIVKGD
jgi:hypothetical protein